MLVVPVGGAPGGPVELYGSAGHHQFPTSMSSVRHTSSFMEHCVRGDKEAAAQFESMERSHSFTLLFVLATKSRISNKLVPFNITK
jgi:hypothetical protein